MVREPTALIVTFLSAIAAGKLTRTESHLKATEAEQTVRSLAQRVALHNTRHVAGAAQVKHTTHTTIYSQNAACSWLLKRDWMRALCLGTCPSPCRPYVMRAAGSRKQARAAAAPQRARAHHLLP